MRKKKIFCFLLMMILCASACSKKSDNYQKMEESKDYLLPILLAKDIDKANEEHQDSSYEQEYKIEKLEIEGVSELGGILCREKDIVVADKGNDRIVVADFDGKFIKGVGVTGNGELEFMSPGNLLQYEDHIYVIDEKNYRIQVLDEDLNFVKEIKTKTPSVNDPYFVYQYIAVDKTGVYLSGLSFDEDSIDLYVEGKNEPIKFGKNFCGPMYNFEDKIYTVNSLIKAYNKDDNMSYRTGPNWLFFIDKEKHDFERLMKLPVGMMATDFIINENNILCLSISNCSLMMLDREGKYVTSLFRIDELQNEQLSSFSINPLNQYYVTAPKSGAVFRCSLEE